MATNCTFYSYGEGPDGRGSERSGVISLADVTVNTTPTATGGWNTASVTADKQRSIFVDAAAAATAGVEPGWYDNIGGANFRKQVTQGADRW